MPELTVSALMPVVYDELRRLARHYLAQERGPQTIQATALVHEAYLRLAKDKKQNWQGTNPLQGDRGDRHAAHTG